MNTFLVVGTAALALWLWTRGTMTHRRDRDRPRAHPAHRRHVELVHAGAARHLRECRRRPGEHGDRRPSRTRSSTARTPAPLSWDRARCASRTSRSITGARAASSSASRSRCGRARRSASSARAAPARSTLVSLLLRLHDLEGGRILIDGQDIAGVTQDTLRDAIAVVTQDTSLLHRSIRDNIAYGRPSAVTERDRAGGRARPCGDFIPQLEDHKGRAGLRGACRRTRRQALRRTAPAHRDRPGHPQGCADPGPRRGDLGARFGGRGGDPGIALDAHAGQDGDRDRPPALDHRRPRPAARHRPGPHRRGGEPRPSFCGAAGSMPACGSGSRADSSARTTGSPPNRPPDWNRSNRLWTGGLGRAKEPPRGDAQSHCARVGAYAWSRPSSAPCGLIVGPSEVRPRTDARFSFLHAGEPSG